MKAKVVSITKEESMYIGTCSCCEKRIRAKQKMVCITVEWDYPVYICRECITNITKMFKDKEKILTNKK